MYLNVRSVLARYLAEIGHLNDPVGVVFKVLKAPTDALCSLVLRNICVLDVLSTIFVCDFNSQRTKNVLSHTDIERQTAVG